MFGKKPKVIKRQYAVLYYFDARSVKKVDAHGSTQNFASACGNAARHVAKSDFDAAEYRKAVIVDRKTEQVVRIYARTATGMSITEY